MKFVLIVFIFIFSFSFISCEENGEKKLSSDLVNNPQSAEGDNNISDLPQIKFKKTTHDFGELAHGERVSYSFKFINAGISDLIISEVSTSCGCTVANFPKEAVKSGEEGFLEVVFDSNGERGYISKSITVLSNSQPNKTKLFIKAIVNRN